MYAGRRLSILAGAVGLTILMSAGAARGGPQATACLESGGLRVEVDHQGLIVRPPAAGLHTIDGPRADFVAGDVEFFAIAYDIGGRHVEAAAASAGSDWGGRSQLVPLSFRSDDDNARAVLATSDLELSSTYSFDPLGPYLIVTMDVKNTSSLSLNNVLLAREWWTRNPGWTFPPDYPALAGAPGNLSRRLWVSDDLPPGRHASFTFSWGGDLARTPTTGSVPLQIWTDSNFPSGLDFGATNGISIGDYDADGWPDVYCAQSHRLWQNVMGQTWVLAATLNVQAGLRYGCAFGDYDRDGLPDIASAPRQVCMDLLRNLGGGPHFLNVATDTAIVPVRACGYGETMCWGDTDGDGWLDLFVPVYPNTGNFFYWNRGPVGPGGANAFFEQSAVAGLNNPPGASRPEGAQFCDYDFDGDIDLYSNGTLYQNRSTPGLVHFDNLPPATSGLTYYALLEEGAVFCDYDLDGDFDLAVVYSSPPGLYIYENCGDGTFIAADTTTIDSPLIGLDLGLSAEDWDLDGDIDLTTRQVFRPNMLVETGSLHFTVGTHTIPSGWLTSATPSWGDWDRDGDLDCALGNWLSDGHFLLNTTYGPSTPPARRRHVRIVPLRDGPPLPQGLETEYGAVVEVRPVPATDGFRRKKFTSSSNGYLNQNEYGLTFALPRDPFPNDPTRDVTFDVIVDFPSPQGAPLRRIDKFANPALGGIDLATLVDREIRVFRSGVVVKNGAIFRPSSRHAGDVYTTTNGLILPSITTPLTPPVTAPYDTWVGIELDTHAISRTWHTSEVIIDGQLAAPVSDPGGDFNVALWDVTNPLLPVMLQRRSLITAPRNNRSFLPLEGKLPPGRILRLVAHVTKMRSTPATLPALAGNVTVTGGLVLHDTDPTTGKSVAAAGLDPANVYVALRLRR